jgi:hypothetical protein
MLFSDFSQEIRENLDTMTFGKERITILETQGEFDTDSSAVILSWQTMMLGSHICTNAG